MSMPKLNTAPITEKDLEAYLASESDFAVEMSVLSLLRKMDFRCSHSGRYEDPVTRKIRQYDLRAVKSEGDSKLGLAVECKNLRPNFPLLISAVPRTPNEAFYELIAFRLRAVLPAAEVLHVDRGQSIYRQGDMVGKRIDQVGRTEHTSELFSDDSATFDKLSQAINSSKDIFVDSAWHSAPPFIRMVVPVLVVPADVLWQVEYDSDGNISKHPYHVNEATLFIDHAWTTLTNIQNVSYRISHLHIVTLPYLEEAVKLWMGPNGFFLITNIGWMARGRGGAS
jgi:hypothetical protein